MWPRRVAFPFPTCDADHAGWWWVTASGDWRSLPPIAVSSGAFTVRAILAGAQCVVDGGEQLLVNGVPLGALRTRRRL